MAKNRERNKNRGRDRKSLTKLIRARLLTGPPLLVSEEIFFTRLIPIFTCSQIRYRVAMFRIYFMIVRHFWYTDYMNFLLLFLGLAPSFIWLSFFLQEDLHPEPRKMIFSVFLIGAFAALGAYFVERWTGDYLRTLGILEQTFYYVLAFAVIEEVVKFIAAYSVIRHSKYFDEPIDAMIYMMTAAMGLAAVENIAVAFDGGLMSVTIGSLLFRFLGATLLHALSASVIGYYWARGIIKKHVFFYVLIGLFMGTLLHLIFNYVIIVFDGGLLYSIAILVLSAFFVFYDFEKIKHESIAQ
jgi:RsiW-degrading membrane proteinase PrsW (M82 family)